MATPIDRSNSDRIAFQIKGDSSFLSNKPGQSDANAFGDELSSALNSLSQLDNSEQLREQAVKNGKAIVADWQSPTDDQIDKILFSMKGLF